MAHATDVRTASETIRLTRLRRGARDAKRSAEFYGWLLDVPIAPTADGWAVHCANGDLEFTESTHAIFIEFGGAQARSELVDPDGVPLRVCDASRSVPEGLPALDHVSLMCADLDATTRFYQQLGLIVTWSARGEHERHGVQAAPIAGADWVHVSGADGYLALAQADWNDYGTNNAAAGPPRFVHLGLAVDDLAQVEARLHDAGTAYLRAPTSDIGERLYLNDPDGDATLGRNVEIVQYTPGTPRSGRR